MSLVQLLSTTESSEETILMPKPQETSCLSILGTLNSLFLLQDLQNRKLQFWHKDMKGILDAEISIIFYCITIRKYFKNPQEALTLWKTGNQS